MVVLKLLTKGLYFLYIILLKHWILFQENTPVKVTKDTSKDGPIESVALDAESQVTVEKDLVSQAEQEDAEALLGK